MSDSVSVATGGTVEHVYRCRECKEPMLVRVVVGAIPLKITGAFCGDPECSRFCLEEEV